MYKNLYIEEDIMTEIDTDKLVPTSTEMLVGMIANTDKLVSSNKRWNYADHKDDKNDDSGDEDNLDVEADDYIKDAKKSSHSNNVFKKADSEKDKDHGDKGRSASEKDKTDKSKSKRADTDTEQDTTNSAADTSRDQEPETKNLSKKELMLLKLDMLRKLGELKQCGVHLSQNYNLDSDLDMMQYEYKLHHDIRSKQNSVQWMSHMMIGIIKGTEMFNDNYNPFDMKLSGLSDKISSDMHNYYAVLGDIYEKYNQPGKQMAPEMRLLLMISGAALSMQVNKVLPGIGGMASAVKSEDNLKELRQKAEADSNQANDKGRDYVKKQHDAAAQKAADIKMIQEKELEFQRMNRMMDEKNVNMKKFKENLILSSESPSRELRTKKSQQSQAPVDQRKKEQKAVKPQDDDEEEEDPTQHVTREEIEHIKKMRYMEEQKHLEMMRRMAHQKSEMFRNNNMAGNDINEKRRRDLARQNNQLDNILDSVNADPELIRQKLTKQTKVEKPVQKSSKVTEKPSSKSEKHRSEKQSEKSEDNRSTFSSASTMSVNPKIESIMNSTSDKAKKEMKKKLTEFSDKDENKNSDTKKSKPQEPKVSEKKPEKKAETKSSKQKSRSDKSDEMKFDKNIQMLLENNDSEYDNISKDEISIGSRDKNKNKAGTRESSSKDTKTTGNTDKTPKTKKNQTTEMMDFGAISIGSRNKGTKAELNIGKKK